MASKKKTSVGKTVLVSIIALVLGVLIGYLVGNVYTSNDLEFYLVGNANTNIGLGSEYKEKGAVCNFRGTDYSSELEITYYNENKVEVPLINTTTLTTYYIEYKIDNTKITSKLTRVVNVVEFEDLEINFLMFEHSNAGDCIYIKAGDTDILVDAGATKSDAAYIKEYLTDSDSTLHSYVEDNTLEYVIATHAHEDHIAAFVGTKDDKGNRNGIFSEFAIETLIDFPKSEGKSVLYSEYQEEVNKLISSGTKKYTALECYNNENGASRIIEVAAGIEIEILYNYYYENETDNENNYSVCFMLRRGEEQYLFTGDLEGEGEEYLVQNNNLGKVYLYKAGHHGSKTSSSEELLSTIKPEVVVITCAAFTKEYTKNLDNVFPTTDAINNLAKHVKHLYVSRMLSKDGEKFSLQETVPANGHVVMFANANGTYINCSHSNEDFYNFEIFKKYRSWTTN